MLRRKPKIARLQDRLWKAVYQDLGNHWRRQRDLVVTGISISGDRVEITLESSESLKRRRGELMGTYVEGAVAGAMSVATSPDRQ